MAVEIGVTLFDDYLSKSGDEKIEHSYATHFVDAKRIMELKAQTQEE